MSLYQLIYTSTGILDPMHPDAATQRQQILSVSRRNNAASALTGALLFAGADFAQVLEGPLGAVETTFERIQRDPRHTDLVVLRFEPVARRDFGEWAMADAGAHESNAPLAGLSPQTDDGGRLIEMMRDVARQRIGDQQRRELVEA